jgi:uncharacterized protein (DUF433 family)
MLRYIAKSRSCLGPTQAPEFPTLVGTEIPTAVVAERYKAGESIDELAGDYGRSRKEIEEVIRCELWLEAA